MISTGAAPVLQSTYRTFAGENAMNVLVAIDDDEFLDPIMDTVARLFCWKGTAVKLLHVVEPASLLQDASASTVHGATREILEKKLKKASFLLRRMRINLNSRVDSLNNIDETTFVGTPHRVILDCAEEWNADVIVLGAHIRGDETRLRVSSVSTGVLRHADCPVMVVNLPKNCGVRKSSSVEENAPCRALAK